MELMDDANWGNLPIMHLFDMMPIFNPYSDILKKINTFDFNWHFFLMVYNQAKKKQQETLSLVGAKIVIHSNLQEHIIDILLFVNTYFCGSISRCLEISTIDGPDMF